MYRTTQTRQSSNLAYCVALIATLASTFNFISPDREIISLNLVLPFLNIKKHLVAINQTSALFILKCGCTVSCVNKL